MKGQLDHVAVARVRSWLPLIVEPGMVVELRILNVVDNPKYPGFIVTGYFDHNHLDDLARQAIEWTSKAEGCYVTINPVNPDLLARAANRVIKKPKSTTTDADIMRRVGLVFDADPCDRLGFPRPTRRRCWLEKGSTNLSLS